MGRGAARCWAALILWASLAVPALAKDEVRIVTVIPSLLDSVLVCEIETQGLPSRDARETLLSGLPSALTIQISLASEEGNAIGGAEMEIRVEPDLWEQIFLVRYPLAERRLETLGDVEQTLAKIGPVPVMSLESLVPEAMMQLHVKLAVHPLAPSQIEMARDVVSGESSSEGNRREVAVGIGKIFRFFLGKPGKQPWAAEGSSEFFSPGGLFGPNPLPELGETP